MKTMMLVVVLMMTAVGVRESRAGSWHYDMIASHEQPFLGIGFWKVRHTWSDVWSSQDNRDATQSWMSGVGRCNKPGINGCASAYRSIAYTHAAIYNTNTTSVNYYLDRHNKDNSAGPFGYLVNGVCHTATNRASRKSGLKKVADYNVLGSHPSQSAWGTCGKSWPYGFGISCP